MSEKFIAEMWFIYARTLGTRAESLPTAGKDFNYIKLRPKVSYKNMAQRRVKFNVELTASTTSVDRSRDNKQSLTT